jgi:hypothetical protein
MLDLNLRLEPPDIEFLTALCAEEAMRCRQEQRTIKHLSQMGLSEGRERYAMRMLERFNAVLKKIDEDDGMEGRPDLN